MSRIDKVKNKVDALYQAKNPCRDDWADWLYKKHVFLVADEAERLASRFNSKKDLVMVAGMLHDIADAVMSRFNAKHEAESFKIAREILQKSGFSEDEIKIVVDDAMKYHSCRDKEKPSSFEGKVMATADAIIHIKTDFYKTAIKLMRKENRDANKIKTWALSKIENDFHNKILFEEIKKEIKPDYKKMKNFLKSELNLTTPTQ